jgi:hypothetical protein
LIRGFSVAEEAAAFEKWLDVMKASAVAVLDPTPSALAAVSKMDTDWRRDIKALQSAGWCHDPIGRHYRVFDEGVDHDLAETPYWFAFRPYVDPESAVGSAEPAFVVAAERDSGSRGGVVAMPQRCQRRYNLQILHPLTLRHTETVHTLSSHLARRYFDRYASRIYVIVLTDDGVGDAVSLTSTQRDCRVYADILPSANCTGPDVNTLLSRVLDNRADLVVIHCARGATYGGAELVGQLVDSLDVFIPTYPVSLGDNTLVLTPIQIVQCNGCAAACASGRDVLRSLLGRISTVLGAALCGADHTIPALADTQIEKDRADWFMSGLKDASEIRDGRFHRIDFAGGAPSLADLGADVPARTGASAVPLAAHVAWCKHGWCGRDTRVNLIAALRQFRPRVIVELGSWYGKSTRVLLEHAPANSIVFCVDHFKNSAIYAERHPQVVPEDRLFFNFLRYECFVGCVEESGRKLAKPMSVYLAKMDIHEVVDYLHRIGVPIDMVFIDAEKKTLPLQKLIGKIRGAYPSAVIVGDDHVFESVKEAVRGVRPQRCVIARDDSYIVLPIKYSRSDMAATLERVAGAVHDDSPATAPQIESLVKSGDVAALEAFLFTDIEELWRPLGDGYPSMAHVFFVHYMNYIHRKKNGRGASSRDGENADTRAEFLRLAIRVVESAASPIAYTDAFVTPFDFVTHTITFQ